MAEDINMKEVIEEIKGTDEDELKKVIEKWFESTHTDGMKIGARLISATVFSVIQKHLKKKAKPSLRDYQRAVDEIIKIISVQLTTKQNHSEEENENDGTAESNDNTNS